MPLVRSIVQDAEASKYRFSSLILGIVKSPVPDEYEDGGAHRAASGSPTEVIMFLTKKHISRRTVLRGAGATLALPLLDAMVPAATLWRRPRPARSRASSAASCRTAWPPATGCRAPRARWPPSCRSTGSRSSRSGTSTVILSGLHSRSAEPPPGVTGADHWVAAAFLCADKPKKTAGADVYNGTTIDQIIAQKIGPETLMPSLQLAVEDPAPTRATAARATAAPTPTRSRGRRRPRRCRWS